MSMRIDPVRNRAGKEKVVDFLERWFHVSPDGGNGTLECLIVGMGALVVSALVIALRRHVAAAFWSYVEELAKLELRDPERVLYNEQANR
jgi:hypothetical protein